MNEYELNGCKILNIEIRFKINLSFIRNDIKNDEV